MTLFNPFEYPILLRHPARLTAYSYWQEHIPFALFLVQLLQPRVLVELGTHYGDSYCAFCQAVKELETGSRCFAVDNWQGDEHIPTYGSDVLDGLRAHHDPLYADFSTLVQSDFDDARERFSDRSIDLLHLDGTHTYEAVKHDFESWLPKMSDQGVILFHDTMVLDRGYGVRQFFDEIKTRYPNFEFLHGYGLGVLAIGALPSEELQRILQASESETALLRDLFSQLGQRLSLLARSEAAAQAMNDSAHHKTEAAAAIEQRDLRIRTLENELLARTAAQQAAERQLNLITGSNGYAVLQKFWNLRSLLKSR